RTFNLLIQSQLRYRCATPQVAPGAIAGRIILGTSLAGEPLLPSDHDVGFAARTLGADGHPDRYRLCVSHHPAESTLHERFRSIEVYRPANSKHTVAEELFRLRVPVRVADPAPGRRAKIVWNDPDHPALPCTLRRRFGELGRYGAHDQPERGETNETTDPARSPHTSKKRVVPE